MTSLLVERRDFPALRGHPERVYLDSAASSLLHQRVVDVVAEQLAAGGSAGRGAHRLGSRATEALEGARAAAAALLSTRPGQLVFVKSATEGLNLVAQGWGGAQLQPGDTVLVSILEHHANLLPWRRLAQELGLRLLTVGCDERGDLDLAHLEQLLEQRPRALALTAVSNLTGARVPVPAVVDRVRALAPGCAVVVDGAQAVAHGLPVLDALGVDFFVFSGHKACGPLGAGVVWATEQRWAETNPMLWGGGMVARVGAHDLRLVEAPWRFEAGTPNHPAVVGLAAGLELCGRGPTLAVQAAAAVGEVPGCWVLGAPRDRVGSVSFVVDGVHPHDVAQVLDAAGICVRVGHLCAQPYLRRLGATAAVRASFGLPNTARDIDRLVEVLATVRARLRVC